MRINQKEVIWLISHSWLFPLHCVQCCFEFYSAGDDHWRSCSALIYVHICSFSSDPETNFYFDYFKYFYCFSVSQRE